MNFCVRRGKMNINDRGNGAAGIILLVLGAMPLAASVVNFLQPSPFEPYREVFLRASLELLLGAALWLSGIALLALCKDKIWEAVVMVLCCLGLASFFVLRILFEYYVKGSPELNRMLFWLIIFTAGMLTGLSIRIARSMSKIR